MGFNRGSPFPRSGASETVDEESYHGLLQSDYRITFIRERRGCPTISRCTLLGVGGSHSEALEGTMVDEMTKVGRWETEHVLWHYVEDTIRAPDEPLTESATERKHDSDYAGASIYRCPLIFWNTSPPAHRGRLGETYVRVTPVQWSMDLCKKTIKYELDNRLGQEVSSNPILTLKDNRRCRTIQQ